MLWQGRFCFFGSLAVEPLGLGFTRADGGLAGVHYASDWCRKALIQCFCARARALRASGCKTLASSSRALQNLRVGAIRRLCERRIVAVYDHISCTPGAPLLWIKMHLFITTTLLTQCNALIVPHTTRRVAPLRAAATEEAANPRTFGLALALDDGTRKVHSVAENTQSASV